MNLVAKELSRPATMSTACSCSARRPVPPRARGRGDHRPTTSMRSRRPARTINMTSEE
jgi:hypothetical protein